MIFIRIVGAVAMLLASVSVFSQDVRVSGRVANIDGSPLVGVTIKNESTSRISLSGSNGSYSIYCPQKSKLSFSYVGMKPIVVWVVGDTSVNVALEPMASQLEEVVVAAYGTPLRMAAATGAISSMSIDKIMEASSPNVDLALRGKMSGVYAFTSSGLIADEVGIRVRGTNSLSLSSQPLYVIDGVPVTEVSNLNYFFYGNMHFNPLATLNSNDIESVEVLKDASAAALYGSRAGNGVVVITTKRGREGKVSISYNGKFAVAQAAKKPNLLNASDFITITNERASNWYGTGTTFATEFVIDGKKMETNWMDEVFRNAFQQNHQVAITGGNKQSNFYASADWLDQESIVYGTGMNRYSVRFNADSKIKNWLKVGLSSFYSKAINDGTLSEGYLNGVTIAAYNAPPNTVSRLNGDFYLNALGQLGEGGNIYQYQKVNTYLNAFYHPIALLTLNRNRNTADRNMLVGFAELSPIQDLKLTTQLAIDNITNVQDLYNHPDLAGTGKNYNGYTQVNNGTSQQWTWSCFANYGHNFNLNSVKLMAGMEYSKRVNKNVMAGASNFVSSNYQDILDNLFTVPYAGGDMSERGFASYFGRIAYSYGVKYSVDLSFRTDGFSGFGLNSRYGFFPGISALWNVENEDFLNEIPYLSGLKLRGSWGKVGNSNINPYASQTIYGPGQYGDLNGVTLRQVGNASLGWESNVKINVGIDASLFNSRLSITADIFKNTISDMLFIAPAVLSTGIPGGGVFSNVGKMWNRGLELQITSVNVMGDAFSWSSILNYTTIANKIVAMTGSDQLATNSLMVGKPMGIWRLYEWAGVDPATGRAGYYSKDGKVKYYDPSPSTPANKRWAYADGSTATGLGADDIRTQEGKTGTPTWYGNFDNTFSYKSFDLTVGLQFSGGNYVLNATRSGLLTNYLNNNIAEVKERWTEPGQRANIPKLYWGDRTSLQSTSTLFLEKADFLRLRDITLSYKLPSRLASLWGIAGRIYLRGENLAILTGYKGLDPEISTYRNSNFQTGWENRSIPFPRTYTLGVSLTF